MSLPPSQNFNIGDALMRANQHWNAGQADQAEMACQQVLALWPGQSDAMHLLGLMAHAYGNLDLAIAHLRQACMAPRAPAVYSSNLAEMCRQKGLLAEGEQAARRAVAMDPRQAGAWNNLGIIVQEQGKLDESRQCLQRVLELEPDNAQAHNNMANTCKHLGLLDQAERHWMRALELVPNYAETYSNLSNLMTDRAEYDRAADYARRAIEINPRLADAYLNLAAVETARMRHQDALRWLEALVGFAPAHPSGLAALALSLKQLDQLPRAIETAHRAVAAGPENPEAFHALGQVLQADGQFDAALAAYDQAAALPGMAQEKALVSRAVLHMELGRKDQALAAFADATAAYPASATALFNQADLRRFKPGDPAVARMEALLGPGGLQSPNDRMLLHFALGKAYLDMGESSQAFHHFDAGNAMKRQSISYDPDATEAWVGSITETFTADLLASNGGRGAMSAMPVFVLGMPRSGTTLIEQILASHPSVHGAGELRHMQRLVDEIGVFPGAVSGLPPARLAAMGRAYLDRIQPLARGRRHVVDKMPSNFLYAGLIRLILPDAKIIHTRRDPVDTCLSCYSKLFAAEQAFTYDQAELGRFHAAYQKLMAHWRSVLPPSHFLEVDYEAVVDDVEGKTWRMLDFLGLPRDAACLDFHRTERPVLTASVNQVRQPIYRTSAGRWKAHAAHLQPLLAALGL